MPESSKGLCFFSCIFNLDIGCTLVLFAVIDVQFSVYFDLKA